MTKTLIAGTAALLFISNASMASTLLKGVLSKDYTSAIKIFPFLNKKSISQSQADKVIRFLTKTNNYDSIFAYKENGRIFLEAQPLRSIQKIKFVNSSPFTERELTKAIGLNNQQKFERNKLLKSGEKLKEFYGKKGFFNADIKISYKNSENNKVNIQVEIDKKQPCKIKDIIINSKNSSLNTKITKRVKGFIGDRFTSDAINGIKEKTNDFFIDSRYLTANLRAQKVTYNTERTEAILLYEITDPIRYEILPEGNDEISISEIINAIDFDNFNRASIDPANEIVQSIKNHYLNKGFPHIRTRYNIVEKKQFHTRSLKINIDEGPQVSISDIKFSGRLSRPSNYYRRFLEDNSSALISRGYYNKEDLEAGIKNLTTELQNQGYIKAKPLSTRIEYSNKKKYAKIFISLDEGPLTQLRKINFSGVKVFQRLELLNVLQLQNNSPLRLNKLENSLKAIKNFYKENGYLEMKILNEKSDLITYDEKGTSANLFLKIYEGPKVIVSSIAIEGNKKTKDYVILNEVDFKLGDTLTPSKILESITRLNKLGIFSNVRIQTLEQGSNISQRTVLVQVSERNPGILKLGVGFTNRRGITVRGYTGYAYKNIGGTARSFTSRINLESNIQGSGHIENEVSLGYLEPFLFDSRVRGRVNFTHSEIVRTFYETDDVSEIDQSQKINFLLEKDITSNIKFSWLTWSLDLVNTFQVPKNPKLIDGSLRQIALIGPILDIDFRDNPFLPTKGHYANIDIGYSDPAFGSSELINFVKSEALYTYYYRILGSPKFLWVNSVRGGYLKNLSDKSGSGIPATYAFFLGGINSIRGYSGTINDRIPSNSELSTAGNNLIINTESTYYLFKSELRFPIYGSIGGVLFYDTGEVQVKDKIFSKPIHSSVGIGLRYNTPVGPLSIDYGHKIDAEDLSYDKRFQIHFSIGTF